MTHDRQMPSSHNRKQKFKQYTWQQDKANHKLIRPLPN